MSVQAEMKSFIRIDTLVLKQHFEKKLIELEEEKRLLQVGSHYLCAAPLHGKGQTGLSKNYVNFK